MMKNRFEDLWNSADDGASAPPSPLATRGEAEFEELLDAWFLERRNSIECEILLDQSRKLIARLISDGDVTESGRKKAHRLILAINRTLRTAES